MIVKIFGVPYTINRVHDPLCVDHDGEEQRLWGQISYGKHSINYLASSKEQDLRTVLHEILHGIVYHGSIRELIDANGEHLEMPINQLAHGLAGVLESAGIQLLQADLK